MQRTLHRKLIGPKAHRQLLAFLGEHLPHFTPPTSAAAWRKQIPTLRAQVLDLFFRGHPKGLLAEQPQVHWGDRIETGAGYTIRKLRYEGYPGLWVPALLYEPDQLGEKAPAVLNPNGHHAGGKAMDYKQARCINLAKRGMLALNTEFLGMGELRADIDHNRIAHLDLCGIAGIGVFYLLMKRGLDVLLAHPKADPERIGMTGLSGGGWQTALLSALDERVKVIVPVAGHSAVWQRRGCIEDIGDQEQCPADLCTIADYDTLSALFAPRPTLLIYNRHDDCCFQTRRARKSIYEPIRPVFALLGARDNVALHDNTDPGTHNYERDNRCQLYKFLNQHWGLETSRRRPALSRRIANRRSPRCRPAPRQRHPDFHRAGRSWQDQKAQKKSAPSSGRAQNTRLVTQAAAVEESVPASSRHRAKAQRRYNPTLPIAS